MQLIPRRLRVMHRLARRDPPLLMPWTLKRRHVLGMNQRNADYVMRYNQRRHYPLVDDKLQTKRLAEAAGIAVPQTYGVIQIQHQTREIERMLDGRGDFVVKPAHGAGGNGIMVITGRRGGRYLRASGVQVSSGELEHYVSNVLSGMYSLGGLPDSAILEYRVQPHPIFNAISHQGVPDIRTIVFRGVPVASMVRLPSRLSDGKANLHQGAIGAGIDLANGETVDGVWLNRVLSRHPDTGAPVRGIRIPDWDMLLELAARSYDLTQLGYLGVDVVLDEHKGPLVLEYNARPGLNIQLANQMGLRHRLRQVEALEKIPDSAASRVALARELFSS